MSFQDNSPTVSQWITKFQSPKYQPSSVLHSRRSYVEDLVIEDLDFSDLEISSSTVRSTLSTTLSNSIGTQIPEVVSEACTENNFYILVRVPTNVNNKLPSTASAYSQTTPKTISEEKTTCSYQNVHRTIFPIPEEEPEIPAVMNSPSKKKTIKKHQKVTCWTKESQTKEEFLSKTKIVNDTNTCLLPNEVPLPPTEKKDSSTQISRIETVQCQNQIELQEMNLKSINLKGPPNVSLENYGILITPTKMPKTENLLVFQVDTEAETRRNSRYTSCFQWLRKLFNMKRRKSGIVHAKVYKTYFVKWKKYSDEVECSCKKDIGGKSRKHRPKSA